MNERSREESEARFAWFFEAAFEGIVLHEDGIILDVNQAAADLFGYTASEMIGRHVREFGTPESYEVVRRHIAAGDERPYEAVGMRKDGTTFPGEIRAKNVTLHGRTIRVAAMRDLTERKNAEKTLEEYARRLQNLSRRLLTVQEEERQRLSRELHDEVGQIVTGLRLALERGERVGGDGLRQALGEARGMLQELTDRVRDLSLHLRPPMLDDLGLIPALLYHFRRYTAQTGVEVVFRHEGLEQQLSPEGKTAAYRIVQEALTNAARHAGVAEAAVRISLDRRALQLEIEDHGAGFDAAAALAGTAGCGVPGMRQRTALLGGKLTVTSTPGLGTLVRAEWPEDAGNWAGGKPMGLRLIVADDHRMVRQGLCALLRTEPDFQLVGEAADGVEALRLVERLRPDVLVLDLMMPALGGLEVARQTARRSPRTQTVVVSIHKDEAYVVEALRAGAAGYVLKDCGADELFRAVREVAGGRRFISPPLSEAALQAYIRKSQGASADPFQTLTAREREVFQLTAEGHSGGVVAVRLFISPRTVESHRANLMRKLGLHNHKELIQYAARRGMLPGMDQPPRAPPLSGERPV